jgi:hypothetical protein
LGLRGRTATRPGSHKCPCRGEARGTTARSCLNDEAAEVCVKGCQPLSAAPPSRARNQERRACQRFFPHTWLMSAYRPQLVVRDLDANRGVVDADEATVTFDASTGRITASGPGFEIAGNIQHRREMESSKSPVFLSCELDDGTHTQWRLYGMTDSQREELHEECRRWRTNLLR